jgi:hypothetical protein
MAEDLKGQNVIAWTVALIRALKTASTSTSTKASGIRPESGVGGYAHEVKLDNIYDPQTRTHSTPADLNGFESAVINAGFDGYIAPFGNNQAAVVLLGQ